MHSSISQRFFGSPDKQEKFFQIKVTDWALQIDSLGTGEAKNWLGKDYIYSDSIQIKKSGPTIALPPHSEFIGSVWYFSDFVLDPVQNVSLAIDTIDQYGLIWVNGTMAGLQKGEICRKFDISENVIPGKNRLTIKVTKKGGHGRILGDVIIKEFENETDLYKGKYAMMKAPAPPDWVKNAVIYEVNIRQYTREGTFNAFAKHLPDIKDLGADIIWFMPIHPIGVKNRKGTLGSYYAVQDYYGINPVLSLYRRSQKGSRRNCVATSSCAICSLPLFCRLFPRNIYGHSE